MFTQVKMIHLLLIKHMVLFLQLINRMDMFVWIFMISLKS